MKNLLNKNKTKAAVLTTLLLLALAVPLFALPTASAAAAISLRVGAAGAPQGPCATVVTVTGSGYTPNLLAGTLTITFGGLAEAWTAGGGTDTSGAIATGSTFTVNDAIAPGTYSVIVSDTSGNTASASFTITTPSVTITPLTGQTGVTVLVSASGFKGSAAIASATMGGVNILPSLSPATASSTGSLYATFTAASIPYTTTYPTTATVVLTDANGNVGTATFTLTPPTITLSSTSAQIGDTITVTGSGFKAGATIQIGYGSPVVALVTVPVAITASPTGTFVATFAVPAGLVKGAVTITALDGAGAGNTNAATANLNIQPKITITMGTGASSGTNYVPQGQAGAVVTVVGSGFAASSALTASWIGPATVTNTFTTPATGATGAFTIVSSAAAWPATAGTYALTLTDASTNSASGNVVATSTGSFWVLDKTSAPVGATVTATYFGAPSTGASNILVGSASTGLAVTPTAAAYPTANTQAFVIPNVLPGFYTVSGTVDWAGFTATLTVTTASPTITLSQTSGPKGTTPVTVTGSGFIPASTVTVTFGGVSQGTTTATATGAILATFTVPAFPAAAYAVIATDGPDTASTAFTITAPSVSLQTTTFASYVTGTAPTIKFNATGFAPTSALTVTIGTSASNPITPSMGATTDAFGVAYGIFSTPNDNVAGATTFTIADAAGNTYTTTITVTPKIKLTPSAAPVGNVITLTGNGFAASKTISLALNTTTPTYLQLYTGTTAGAATGATGAITGVVTFTIPTTLAGGAYIATVSDFASPNNTATATLTVTAPAFNMTPTSGAAGITVAVNGTGWLPSTAVTILFGSTPVVWAAGGTTSAAGALVAGTDKFVIPSAAAGTYTVTLNDGMETATNTFTVTTAAITVNATSGNVGDIIKVEGTGFDPADAPATLMFGGANVLATILGPGTATVLANGTLASTISGLQVQGIMFAVPAGSVAGANTITITFAAPAITASTTFNVVPKITTVAPVTGVLRGTTLTITANGFAATSAITATFGGSAAALSVATTSGTGTIVAATYTLPVTVATGANALVITDAAGNSASVTVTVGVPTVTLGSATAAAGSSLQVTGTGYFAAATVQYVLTFDGAVQTTTPATLTSGSGSIIGFFTVPAGATAGDHTVALTDSNGNTASATLTVGSGGGSGGAPTINSATLGSTAQTQNGAGTAQTTFAAGTEVNFGFSLQASSGSGNVMWRITVQQPDLSVSFMTFSSASVSTTAVNPVAGYILPSGAPAGTYTAQIQIYASDGVTPLAVTTVTFTVE